jgi:hypothetical protein
MWQKGDRYMAQLQISGPHLQNWPGVLAELERLNIAHETLRYVEVTMKQRIPREWPTENTKTAEVQAVAVLHSGDNVPLTLTELIYNAPPVQG